MSKRKRPGEGFEFEFHGAFSKKADAEKRARQKKGFVRLRIMPFGKRYVVMVKR